MSTNTSTSDVLGIGFGPASLAISIAIAEQNALAAASSSAQTKGKEILGDGKMFSSLGGLLESLQEHQENEESGHVNAVPRRKLKAVFVERHIGGFKWHPGMMLEGSRMQISFLKDLATLRNPTSSYTFLNYLHSLSPSRLLSFISLSTFTPSRREFADYLGWAAKRVADDLAKDDGAIEYGEEVVAIEAVLPKEEGGEITSLKVTSRNLEDNTLSDRHTRNLVVSSGGSARLPHQLSGRDFWDSGRVIHSSQYLENVDKVLDRITATQKELGRPLRIGVIGAGQSAGEIFLSLRSHLARRMEDAPETISRPEVDLLFRRTALRPADDSPFSNEIFDPGMSQAIYGLGEMGRRQVTREAKSTNYSVVNPKTLESIYEAMYAQKVEEDIKSTGTSTPSAVHQDPKLQIHPCSEILHATLTPANTISLTILQSLTRETRTVEYDALFCGTGYDRQSWRKILFPSLSSEKSNSATATLTKLFEHHQPTHTTASSGFLNHEDLTPSSSITSSPPSSVSSSRQSLSRENSNSSSNSFDFETRENYRLDLPSDYKFLNADGKEVCGKFRPTVWLQGSNEASHGISDSLLSVLAVRSGEVVSGILSEGYFAEGQGKQ